MNLARPIQLTFSLFGSHYTPMRKTSAVTRKLIFAFSALSVASACSPTVRLEAPREPITINLNVKIDQEVRVKLDREVEDLISSNPDIF